MSIRGWIASVVTSYYARTRNGALLVAMLFLACALSYTRAHAGVSVGPDAEYPVRDARELIGALRSEDPAAQKTAKAMIERADAGMIGELLSYGRNPGQREIALKVVALMGSKAVPALFQALEDPESAAAAGSVLFRVLGPRDAGRIPELIKCAEGMPAAKNYCAQCLVKVAGPKAAGQVPALIKALDSADPVLRAFAAAALGTVGKGGASAAPALRTALKDSDAGVRDQAKAALRKVGA